VFTWDRERALHKCGFSSQILGLTTDLELSKLLIIRQCIGRASLATVEQNAKTRRKEIIEKLFIILRVLLPLSLKERIEAFAVKLVDKSISLRNAMTTEQAIYQCIFPNYGDVFDERTAETGSGEEPIGNVLICIFPGLKRFTVLKKMSGEFLTVVKAEVKLEGIFGKNVRREECAGENVAEEAECPVENNVLVP